MKQLEFTKLENPNLQPVTIYEARLGTMSYFIHEQIDIKIYHPTVLAKRPELAAKEGVFSHCSACYGPNDKPGLIPMTRLSSDGMTFDECKRACQRHYEAILNA
jgi:hypothetical protein